MRRTATVLISAIALLLAFGLVLLYSASAVRGANPNFYLVRQLMWLAVGVPVSLLAGRLDYRLLRRPAILVPIALAMAGGLVAVFAFPKINGSHRWISLGHFAIQPSEFAKVAVVVILAAWFDRIGPRARSFWRGAVVPGFILGSVVALLLLEPDFGTALVTGVVGLSIMLAAGTRYVYLLAGGAMGLSAGGLLLWLDPVRRPRLLAFIEMVKGGGSTSEAAHQLTQSINAFTAGGPWGVGLNNSIQKYHYLPEAHTDFIFAIAGEEFGLSATWGVLLLFAVILVCGTLVALRANDRFGRLVALGATVLICFAQGFNIGVVTGRLPTKGLALPFLSYGGSSLVASLITMGLLVGVALRTDTNEPPPMRNALQNL